ncbi:hypothetical protein JQ628_16220 [Bradyrhizobium lablabi]|uniref:hypothetical protein n=1 Tax=Bradyrhizobium lablabi TaxID=722472 RepID=UPI001BA4CBA6|nr:hypothetical protein [Bradyrhizobium lablabi]MBR1123073.1 hypothetical protein [Bradyrhizobium lablabi]
MSGSRRCAILHPAVVLAFADRTHVLLTAIAHPRIVPDGAGALGLIWAIAAYSIVFGITFIAPALRLRNHEYEPVAA